MGTCKTPRDGQTSGGMTDFEGVDVTILPKQEPPRVYGWESFRYHETKRVQSREVVAARSAAEVRRITGMTRTEWENSGCETHNDEEIELARSKPGTVFWQPLYGGEWQEGHIG